MEKSSFLGKLNLRQFMCIGGNRNQDSLKCGVHTALLIDHILENVFSNLSTDDGSLQNVRLVCKQWNRVATRHMQKRPQLVVAVRKYNFWRLEEKCSQLIRQLKNSNGESENSWYLIPGPFVRFRLCQDIWALPHLYFECTLRKFFQIFHPYLVHLHIEIQQESSLISLRDYFKTIKLPRLQTLIFEDSSENIEKFVKNGRTDVLRAFLAGSPRLQEIGLLFPKFKESPQREIDLIVTKFLHDIASNNVRNLILSVKISDSLLTTLIELKDKFQLTHLQLFLQSSKFSGHHLTKLLQTQHKTLKTLKLIDIREGCEFSLEFPGEMDRLEKLHIRGWHDSLRNVKFSAVSYKKDLPKLKSLHLDVPCGIPGNGFAWLDSFIPVHNGNDESKTKSSEDAASFCSTSVEILRLPTGFNCVHFAKRIPTLFPKLSCLEINLTPFSMASPIFSSLDCLRELKIYIQDFSFYVYSDVLAPCRALDKMLTGIDVESHDHDLFSKKKLADVEDEDLVEIQRKPSLLNLKNLQRLEIKELENRTIPLTDVTGYLAFLQMKNLRVLDVGSTLMRKDCLKRLAKRFPSNMAMHLNNSKSKGKYKEYVTIHSGCSYASSSPSISGCSVQ
ncbi:unnamed protein product [Orchesella dallaii]|uniref:F-box domain-containing protein n=1 Tax=Orchesella dallaii TaxID=48710 RepID=A0ABP1RW78_9HEXA